MKKLISFTLASAVLPRTAAAFHTAANITFLMLATEKQVCPLAASRDVAAAKLRFRLPPPHTPKYSCSLCVCNQWEEN